jgi:hypothetical protein
MVGTATQRKGAIQRLVTGPDCRHEWERLLLVKSKILKGAFLEHQYSLDWVEEAEDRTHQIPVPVCDRLPAAALLMARIFLDDDIDGVIAPPEERRKMEEDLAAHLVRAAKGEL